MRPPGDIGRTEASEAQADPAEPEPTHDGSIDGTDVAKYREQQGYHDEGDGIGQDMPDGSCHTLDDRNHWNTGAGVLIASIDRDRVELGHLPQEQRQKGQDRAEI